MRSQVVGDLQQRQIFFEGRTSPYSSLIELLVEQREAAAGLAVAERAKAKVLLDTLQSGRDHLSKYLTLAERTQEREFIARLTTINAQLAGEKQDPSSDPKRLAELSAGLDRARIEYESFLTSLYAEHPRLRLQRDGLAPLSLDDAGTLLPDARTALLEFAVSEEKTLLFVLSKAGKAATPDLQVFSLPIKAKDLADRTRKFRQTLANPGRDVGFKAEATALHDLLLKPARAQLKGKTSLVIVPDGPLWELPFQALFVAGVPTTVVSQWKVLDVSTQELMVEFHRQLKTKPAQGKAEALRQAALKVMKSARHPFDWAGFILVGDGR